MSGSREIMNLHVGTYANYVGTHWLNIQKAGFKYSSEVSKGVPDDEVENNLMFGFTSDKNNPEYFPRLISVDVNENFKSFDQENNANDLTIPRLGWRVPDSNAFKDPSVLAGRLLTDNILNDPDVRFLYDLNDVQKWSDFLQLNYNTKTNCSIDPFLTGWSPSTYYSGVAVYNNENFKETFEDAIRKFAEECDNLQGYHIILDGNNAFTALGHGISDYINDEYYKKSVIMFPVFENSNRLFTEYEEKSESLCRLYCLINGLSYMLSNASLVSLLSLACDITSFDGQYQQFPSLQYQHQSMYHTSSILAIAIENVTLPYRLVREQCMSHFIDRVTQCNKKLLSTALNFPFMLNCSTSLFEVAKHHSPDYRLVPVTPSFNHECKTSLVSGVLRGVCKENFRRSRKIGDNPEFYSKEELLNRYMETYLNCTEGIYSVVEEACFIPVSFPRMFSQHLFNAEFVTKGSYVAQGITGTSVAAALVSSDSTGKLMSKILDKAETFSAGKKFSVIDHFDKDCFEEAMNNITLLKDVYLE